MNELVSKSQVRRIAAQEGGVAEEVEASCPRCRQALTIIQLKDGREVAFDRPSGGRHVCWDLPSDAVLLTLDDD